MCRESFQLAYGTWHVVERVVVKLKVLVFGSRHSPIEQIQIVAFFEHVLDEAVPRPEIGECRAGSSTRKPATREQDDAFLWVQNRDIVVYLGLIERPNQLLGSLGNGGLGCHYLGKGLQPLRRGSIWIGDGSVSILLLTSLCLFDPGYFLGYRPRRSLRLPARRGS